MTRLSDYYSSSYVHFCSLSFKPHVRCIGPNPCRFWFVGGLLGLDETLARLFPNRERVLL